MWRLNPKCSLHYRHWGNEWVVFDVGAGQTHEMDTVAATLLMHSESGWLNLAEIHAGISQELELTPDAALLGILEPLLRQFVSLGLLEQDLA